MSDNKEAIQKKILFKYNPQLASEWNKKRNTNLNASDFSIYSKMSVWWICKKGHEWKAAIQNRFYGNGCPYCSGRLATKENNLKVINPELASQWHPQKNGSLHPENVLPNSNKKAWWLCKKGHEWEAVISSRNIGSNCPFCSGYLASSNYCLHMSNPELSKDWHPKNNLPLTPKNVTPRSGRLVWWLCKEGHEWKAKISDRQNGNGCPYCAGHRATKERNLAILNPTLAKQWHSEKNGQLRPDQVTPNSSLKVWWQCIKGHEWEASIDNRSKSRGCPYCSGKRVNLENSLLSVNPKLAKEWHPIKNGDLKPINVTTGSSRKIWWLCKNQHEWQATIVNRNKGIGCPYCSGQKATKEFNLLAINPKLSMEWHPIKNGNLFPKDVMPHSGKSVWWICKRGHEWKTKILNRSYGTGCPFCDSKASLLELRLFSELKFFFKDTKHRDKLNNREIDVFIPSLLLGFEIDGFYWHRNNFAKDLEKTNFLKSKGVDIIRIRENGLKKVSSNDIEYFARKDIFGVIKSVIKIILHNFNLLPSVRRDIQVYLCKNSFINESGYNELLDRLPAPPIGLSIVDKNPKLAKEWHPLKNGKLTPSDVWPGSGKIVWWKCKKGHEWKARIQHRFNGSGCPYCAKRLSSVEYNLLIINPELAKQWHPTRNENFNPSDFTPHSNKKVWWLCKNQHEWQATINNRSNGSGCPFCSTNNKKSINL